MNILCVVYLFWLMEEDHVILQRFQHIASDGRIDELRTGNNSLGNGRGKIEVFPVICLWVIEENYEKVVWSLCQVTGYAVRTSNPTSVLYTQTTNTQVLTNS
jgi:hypothetical protein